MLKFLNKLARHYSIPKKDLITAEEHLITREENAVHLFGLQQRLKNTNSRQRRFLTICSKMGIAGAFCFYIYKVVWFRGLPIYQAGHDIIYSDHSNGLIRKKIFDAGMVEIAPMRQFYPSRFVFFNVFNIFSMILSFRRAKYCSPTSFQALLFFWIYYFSCRDYFAKSHAASVIVVDDIDPLRLAMLLAAKHERRKVAIARMIASPGRPCPIDKLDVLFGWSKSQADELEGRWQYFVQLVEEKLPMKIPNGAIIDKKVIGVALNAFFSPDGLKKLVSELADQAWIDKILLLPHPRMKSIDIKFDAPNFFIMRPDVNRADFFAKIDFLIAGCTSVTEKSLSCGIPVVHDHSLDNFELKKPWVYLRYKLIPDNTNKPYTANIIKSIHDFYSSKSWQNSWEKFICAYPDAISVSKAVDYLSCGQSNNA